MKRTLLFLLLCSGSLHADIGTDKYAHASVSYALSYTGYHILPEPLRPYSPLFALAVGVAKELVDPVFDKQDLLADGIGVGFSIVVFELE